MATIYEVPPTDELFRPILEKLRTQNGPISFEDLVADLSHSLHLAPDPGEPRRVWRARVELALLFLESQEAIEASEPFKPNHRRRLRRVAPGAGLRFAREGFKRGGPVEEKAWSIATRGRMLSDGELASSFHVYEPGEQRPWVGLLLVLLLALVIGGLIYGFLQPLVCPENNPNCLEWGM